jgi:hypothetical protein
VVRACDDREDGHNDQILAIAETTAARKRTSPLV